MQPKENNHNQEINILSLGAPVRHPFIDELIDCTLMALNCTNVRKQDARFDYPHVAKKKAPGRIFNRLKNLTGHFFQMEPFNIFTPSTRN